MWLLPYEAACQSFGRAGSSEEDDAEQLVWSGGRVMQERPHVREGVLVESGKEIWLERRVPSSNAC